MIYLKSVGVHTEFSEPFTHFVNFAKVVIEKLTNDEVGDKTRNLF